MSAEQGERERQGGGNGNWRSGDDWQLEVLRELGELGELGAGGASVRMEGAEGAKEAEGPELPEPASEPTPGLAKASGAGEWEGAVAEQGGAVAERAGAIAEQAGTAVEQAGRIAEQAGAVAGEATAVAGQTGPMAEQTEPNTEQAGAVAELAGPITGQAGPIAKQDRPNTEQAGVLAEQAERNAEQAGPNTGQAGAVAEQAGPITGQAGPIAKQDRPNTEQAGPVAEQDGSLAGRAPLPSASDAAEQTSPVTSPYAVPAPLPPVVASAPHPAQPTPAALDTGYPLPPPAPAVPAPSAAAPTAPLGPPPVAPLAVADTPARPAHTPAGPASPYPAPATPAPPHPSPTPPPRTHIPRTSPQPPSLPSPESVPTLDPRLAVALGRPQHGDSLAHRTGRTLRRLTSSVSQDVAEQTRVARELQQPLATGRVVAVTSIRGGVGKSTVAALLGRTFNHYRHDPVLTLEADAALGTLPVRMGAESVRWSCADLARILTPAMQLTDVIGYLVPVSNGGWLLPASQGRVGAPLDVRTYRTVTLALRRYFAVTVVDCETLPGEVARTAMDTAHARIVVAPTTAEGVGGTRQVLDWLGQLPHSALSTTVVALTAHSPDMTLDVKAARAHLKETGVSVVVLPYDRHLAAGGPIHTDLLAAATREATLELGAEALRRAAVRGS
ncbi:hypothetical protein [Streptomyces cylindrosporus]|uniref:MinD-like ATPase involved in chromosome partitioning or flagellar assembly n=1 Tax=Streptomyces cylindrosporus TaxID=2927583 RepID=A0ABS9YHC3_9ACTN|nr:hypothetical protein [Streptomyces cylindrosporus]MCI3276633.1 hypothetical protein [Streptomyces cylindrosporus]